MIIFKDTITRVKKYCNSKLKANIKPSFLLRNWKIGKRCYDKACFDEAKFRKFFSFHKKRKYDDDKCNYEIEQSHSEESTSFDDMISKSNDNDIDEGDHQYYEKGKHLRLVGDGKILSEDGDEKRTKQDRDFIVADEDLSESGVSSKSSDSTESFHSTTSDSYINKHK
jgi:hypothetical protein